jgi:hypothetical protein
MQAPTVSKTSAIETRFAHQLRSGLQNGGLPLPEKALKLASLGLYLRAVDNPSLTLPKRVVAAIIASDLVDELCS